METLNIYYCKNLKHNFINKFKYSSLNKLPKLKKIVISFKSKTPNLKIIAISLLAIEFIVNKKAKFTRTKNQNLTLKIKKGQLIGCKVFLTKKSIFLFLMNLILNILPVFIKNYRFLLLKNLKNNDTFSLILKNIMLFLKLEKFYSIFNKIGQFNIIIIF